MATYPAKKFNFPKKFLFWRNKSKFVSLKRILPILSIILLAATLSQAQPRVSPAPEATLVRFYPNPATSNITFDLQKGYYDKGYSLEVYSFMGRKMYETANFSQRTTLNLTDFTRGVYIYQLHDKSGKMVESGKFQVSK